MKHHDTPNVEQSKHYRYYQNYKHNTKEYMTLKDKIEELVKVDDFHCFFQKNTKRKKPSWNNNNPTNNVHT